MKTKYRISVENTYLGAIASVPDSLFDDLANTSLQAGMTGSDDNNNPLMFSSLNYECRLKSSTSGEMRFYAGHHKHAFSTCDRPISCKVIKGQMKVKCNALKWTVSENCSITLKPNSKYFVKNNSLMNDCVVIFKLGCN